MRKAIIFRIYLWSDVLDESPQETCLWQDDDVRRSRLLALSHWRCTRAERGIGDFNDCDDDDNDDTMMLVIALNMCNSWWQDVLILMTSNTMLMMIVMIMCRILKALLVLSYWMNTKCSGKWWYIDGSIVKGHTSKLPQYCEPFMSLVMIMNRKQMTSMTKFGWDPKQICYVFLL